MRGDDAVEVSRVHHHHDVVASDARVVDHDGQGAELRFGTLDHGVDLLLVGDVGHDDEAPAAQRLDLGDDGRAGGFVGEIVDGAGHQRNGSCQVKLDAHATSQ